MKPFTVRVTRDDLAWDVVIDSPGQSLEQCCHPKSREILEKARQKALTPEGVRWGTGYSPSTGSYYVGIVKQDQYWLVRLTHGN